MAGKASFTPEQKEEMFRLYQEGLSSTEVAKQFDCSKSTVEKALRDNGRITGRMKAGDFKEFDKRLSVKNPSIVRVGPYRGARNKTLFRCLKHNEEHEAISDNILRGRGLKCCAKESRRKKGKNLNNTASVAKSLETKNKKETKNLLTWLVQNKPEYSLVEEYKGAKQAIMFYCATHDEHHKTTVSKLKDGSGMLRCCEIELMEKFNSCSIKGAKRKQNIAINFDQRLAESNPKLVRIGDYKGDKIKILFKCLEHNEEHLSMPTNANRKGLSCCRKAKLREKADSKIEVAKNSYDARLAVIGKAVRIDEYINSKTPILHKCLLHNEIHLISPGHALDPKSGMACCLKAKMLQFNIKKVEKAAKRHDDYLQKHAPHIECIEPYEGAHNPILHRCNNCNEEHLSTPVNARQKKALTCCKSRMLKSHAQRRAREGLVGYDDIWMLLSSHYKDRVERASEMYIFEMKHYPGCLKPGIAYCHQSRQKGSKGQYADQPVAVWEFESRIGAILIEQAVRQRTSQFWEHLDDLENWGGFNEVRRMDAKRLIDEVQHAVDSYQAHIEGGYSWQSWALENLNLPESAKEALLAQTNQNHGIILSSSP